MWPWHTYQQQSFVLHWAVQGIFHQVQVLQSFDNPVETCKKKIHLTQFKIYISTGLTEFSLQTNSNIQGTYVSVSPKARSSMSFSSSVGSSSLL